MSTIIAVDFDGTCCTHEYPAIGREIGAISVLRELLAQGHRLILYTMRSGATLIEAVDWLKSHGITFWDINRNPQQHQWSSSPKVYAQLYIDDAALGVPLIVPDDGRPYVDWSKVREQLIALNLLPNEAALT